MRGEGGDAARLGKSIQTAGGLHQRQRYARRVMVAIIWLERLTRIYGDWVLELRQYVQDGIADLFDGIETVTVIRGDDEAMFLFQK